MEKQSSNELSLKHGMFTKVCTPATIKLPLPQNKLRNRAMFSGTAASRFEVNATDILLLQFWLDFLLTKTYFHGNKACSFNKLDKYCVEIYCQGEGSPFYVYTYLIVTYSPINIS